MSTPTSSNNALNSNTESNETTAPISSANTISFESLNLHPAILRAIEESGYTHATPVQAQAIPEVMAGHDVMASAQTGTGKTAAFTLPALNMLSFPHPVKSRGPRILVLVPTRELAAQVNEAARKYGKFLRARCVSIVGGMPYPLQNKLLSQPLDILVATPGRFIDHLERGRIDLSRLQMLVLDEADRMLDMGFMPDVERICAALPEARQTLMFSATFEGEIARIAKDLLKTPKTIQVASQKEKHANIEQRLHYVDDMGHKNKLLEHLLIAPEVNQAIVFTSTKRHADLLAEDLYAAGHKTAALHGDMTQGARNRTLTKLRHGDVKVLVATDVAARGIDVHGITHVINYDLPKFAEDYVHRIGRTGRAGNTGIAISFASNQDRFQVRKIEQFTGQRIEPSVIAGLEPRRPAPKTDGPDRGRRSGRPQGGRPYEARSEKFGANRGNHQDSYANRTSAPQSRNEGRPEGRDNRFADNRNDNRGEYRGNRQEGFGNRAANTPARDNKPSYPGSFDQGYEARRNEQNRPFNRDSARADNRNRGDSHAENRGNQARGGQNFGASFGDNFGKPPAKRVDGAQKPNRSSGNREDRGSRRPRAYV